jgi:hypothetical protein
MQRKENERALRDLTTALEVPTLTPNPTVCTAPPPVPSPLACPRQLRALSDGAPVSLVLANLRIG